jgi:hypothetical protein
MRRHFYKRLWLFVLPFACVTTGLAAKAHVAPKPQAPLQLNHAIPLGLILWGNSDVSECSYNQNHVFDLTTGAFVGYRDVDNPVVILDANGEEIGILLIAS